MTEPTAVRHKRFREALEAFSRSARFGLFKGVQVGRLMPEESETNREVSELTLEQLVEQAHTIGSPAMPLTPEQEDELYHLLIVLSEDTDSTPPPPDEDISVVIPDSFGTVHIPTLDEYLPPSEQAESEDPPTDVPVGSVALELAIRASLAKIVAHDRYSDVRKRTLAEFWDSSWTPAPFEEAISIEQLAALDLAVLFKKRMVTDTRIQSILRALCKVEALLNAKVAVQTDVPETPPPSSAAPKVLSASRESRGSPSRLLAGTSVALPLSVSRLAVMEALTAIPEGQQLMTALLKRFSLDECAGIALGEDRSKIEVADLRSIVGQALTVEERDLVQALLRAPAVRGENIARALFGVHTEMTAWMLSLAAIVAQGLGAVPVHVPGAPQLGFWTANLKLLRQLLKGVQSGSAGRSRVGSPSLASEHLDPYLQGLIESQGVGKNRRTEKRNRLNNRRTRGR